MSLENMLIAEEKVKQDLMAKFGLAEDKFLIQRSRRITVDIPTQMFDSVFAYATHELGFVILCTITGLDGDATMEFIYHIARENGIILNIRIHISKDSLVLKTISGQFPAADIYERELADLLGVKVEGLKKGSRYPLPDGWPEGNYPLRKDWKKEMLDKKEAGHGTA